MVPIIKRTFLIQSLVLSAGMSLLFLGGCSMTPAIQESPAVTALPDSYESETADTAFSALSWWEEFNDPTLNVLVDTALARNFDIQRAMSRIREIQSQYRIARSPLFPAVQATIDGNNSSIPSNTGAFSSIGGDGPVGGFQLPDRFETVTYSASLGLSYELDFWGKNRNAARAALREYTATRADFQTTTLAIVSETIATYFELADLEQQLVRSREIVDLLEDRVELSEDRYQRGLINSFELYTIRQSYETEKAALPLLESSLFEARGRLGILLGYYPETMNALLGVERSAEIQLSPIPAGLPSSLLQERPDVYAAEQRLDAARHRIGVARAAQFPSLSLTASGGTQSSDLANLVDLGSQGFSLLTGAIVQPIFQGGRLKAEVEVAWAQYEQLEAAYAKTVLTAFKEVNSALVGLDKEEERYQFLVEATRNAESSSQAQEDRFVRGVGDYLAFIDARINELRTKNALETARRSLINARLTLHRSLGGAWTENEL